MRASLKKIEKAIEQAEAFEAYERRFKQAMGIYALTVKRPGDFIVLTDWHETITAVTPSAASFLGYEGDELLGHPLSTILNEEDLRKLRTLSVQAFQQGRSEVSGLRFRHKDGHFLPGRTIAVASMIFSVEAELDHDGTDAE